MKRENLGKYPHFNFWLHRYELIVKLSLKYLFYSATAFYTIDQVQPATGVCVMSCDEYTPNNTLYIVILSLIVVLGMRLFLWTYNLNNLICLQLI